MDSSFALRFDFDVSMRRKQKGEKVGLQTMAVVKTLEPHTGRF